MRLRRYFLNLPIKHKLIALTMAISGLALLLACTAFAIYEQSVFHRNLARDAVILARMFGENAASGLAFNDTTSLEVTLKALNANERIVGACVYDKRGVITGTYRRPGAAGGAFAFPAVGPTGQHFGPGRLDTFAAIELAGEPIGAIYIGTELSELSERARRYVVFVGLLLIVCSLVAWALAARLQRVISQPILDLAQTVATVAADKNYAVRAPKQSDDELGRLIDGFNGMLAQIQTRDTALQGARDNLEKRVAERTSELQQENAQRRRAEMSLRLLNSAVEQAKESVLITDAEINAPGPRIVFANPAFTQMTGYTAAEVLGRTPRILQGPHTDRAVLDRLRKNLEQGELFAGEAVNYRKNGEEFIIEWQVAPLRDAGGKITHFVAIQRDISERKKTETALRDSEERYRSLIENASDAMFTLAPDGTFSSLNHAVETIAGLARSAWLGRSFTEMVDPADLPVAKDMVCRIMRGEPAPVHELRGNPILGRPVTMEMTLVAQRNKDGAIIGVQGVGRDITVRKQAEAGRDRLAAILEATTDFVGFTDPAGHVLYINRAGRALLGLGAAEDIHHLTISDLIPHSDNNVIITEGVPRAIRDGTWIGETVLLSRSGREIPVSQVILSHKSPDGKLEFISTIVRDITETKRIQDALQRQQAELRILFDLMPALIWFKDTNNGILRVNRRVAENAGKSIEEIEGQPSSAIYPAEAARFYSDDLEVIRSGSPKLAFVETLRDKAGREMWVQTDKVPVCDKAGNVTGIIVMAQDITERKRAEEELRSKTALLEAQLDSSIDGILIVDNAGKKLIQNKRMAELWRIPREIAEDSLDAREVEFVAGQTKEPGLFVARVQYLYAHPAERSRDEIELQDGRVLDRYSTPVVGPDGRNYGRLWGFRDITERKRFEAELLKTHQELVDASRLAGMAEVATGVLHNVGNVLNSVNVSATIIADQLRQSEAGNIAKLAALFDQHQPDLAAFLTTDPRGRLVPGYLGTLASALVGERASILGELDQLRKNIDHIKEIVAVQQSYARASGIIQTVVLAELVDDALRINAGSFVSHGIEILRDFHVDRPVITDKHKVMQILINLVRNAKYACDDSGRTDKRITLRTSGDADRFTIEVIDNGVGIPPENLTRIFNHGFTTRKDGHGFGLHSGALAAKELGGSLRAQSAGPGLGATFTLELPAKPASPAPDDHAR